MIDMISLVIFCSNVCLLPEYREYKLVVSMEIRSFSDLYPSY